MNEPQARPEGRPRRGRRVARALGSLRLGVGLLVVIAAACVVGIVLPQRDSFQFPGYIHERLAAGGESPLDGPQFVRLARAAGIGVGKEGLDEFLRRVTAGRLTEAEEARLLPRAAVPLAEAQKMRDDEWREAYAAFARRAREGHLTEAERARVALAAFAESAQQRQEDPAVLRLFYVDSYGRVVGGVLVRLGVHHLFRSLWFRALCLLLVVSLVVCSCRRIPSQWRAAFGVRPGDNPGWYERRRTHATVAAPAAAEEVARAAERALARQGFRVRRRGAGEGGIRLEASRGWLGALGRLWGPLDALAGLGRLGSNVVHLGVILVVVGGFVSGRLSFRHGQWAGPGDVVVVPDVSYRLSVGYQLQHLWHDLRGVFVPRAQEPERSAQERAVLAADWRQGHGPPPPEAAFRLEVERFEVRRDTRGKPEYYGCHVVVRNGPPLKAVIEVNRPLVHRGFYVYQQDEGKDYRQVESVHLVVEMVRRERPPSGRVHEEAPPAEVLRQVAAVVRPGEEATVPGTKLRVRVLRYFPHWQIPLRRLPDGRVAAGEARNLSDEPRNPAVELAVEAPGLEPARRWAPLPRPGGPPRHTVDYGPFRITPTSFEPVAMSGLMFKTHPVLLLVWIGCGVMMLGICLCFYCNHGRLWALVRPVGEGCAVYAAGDSFKWRERFRERFQAVMDALAQQDVGDRSG